MADEQTGAQNVMQMSTRNFFNPSMDLDFTIVLGPNDTEALVYANAINDAYALVTARIGQIMTKYRITGDASGAQAELSTMMTAIDAQSFDVGL